MYEVLDRKAGSAGDDRQERIQLSLGTMHARERDSALGALFEYWQSRRSGWRTLPKAEQFQPRCDLDATVAGVVSWIDASGEDPFSFVLRDHVVHTYGDLSGRTLLDHPNRMHADACAFEYLTCKALSVPLYHEIDHTIGGVHRNYVRLLLPTADHTGRVRAIFYAFRLIRPIASVASERPVTLAI